jgi:hypothetical protein
MFKVAHFGRGLSVYACAALTFIDQIADAGGVYRGCVVLDMYRRVVEVNGGASHSIVFGERARQLFRATNAIEILYWDSFMDRAFSSCF